jgi:hypothetical protein
MAGVAEEKAGSAGVIGGCITFPPHFEQTPGDVDVLAPLVSEFVCWPLRLLRRG